MTLVINENEKVYKGKSNMINYNKMTTLINLKSRINVMESNGKKLADCTVRKMNSQFKTVLKVMELNETDDYFKVYDNIEAVIQALKNEGKSLSYASDCIKCFRSILINSFTEEEKKEIVSFQNWNNYLSIYFKTNYYNELEVKPFVIEPEIIEPEFIETEIIEPEPEIVEVVEPEIVEDVETESETESLEIESVVSETHNVKEEIENEINENRKLLKIQEHKVFKTIEYLKIIESDPEDDDELTPEENKLFISFIKTKLKAQKAKVNKLRGIIEDLQKRYENLKIEVIVELIEIEKKKLKLLRDKLIITSQYLDNIKDDTLTDFLDIENHNTFVALFNAKILHQEKKLEDTIKNIKDLQKTYKSIKGIEYHGNPILNDNG